MPPLDDILFAAFALTILGASAGAVLAKNPVRATFFLILSFLPTAGVYIMLHAPFAGILQVLVYTGAILVLFTFVVMMINPRPGPSEEYERLAQENPWRRWTGYALALGVGAATLFSMILAAVQALPADVAADDASPAVDESFGSVGAIGEMVFRDSMNNVYTPSFELLAILILAGIIVAVNLARGRKSIVAPGAPGASAPGTPSAPSSNAGDGTSANGKSAETRRI